MPMDYKATARWMLVAAKRYLQSTPQRRWTTYGVVATFVLAAVLMPRMPKCQRHEPGAAPDCVINDDDQWLPPSIKFNRQFFDLG